MPKAHDGIKLCIKCKLEKPISDFNHDKTRPDGLMSMCKKCKREYRLSPFYKSREKELEKTQKYKDRKIRYHKNGGSTKYSHKVKGLKVGNAGKHTLTEIEWDYILIKQENKCAICGCIFDNINKPQHDCIIPLSKGGVLEFKNAQALCIHCNAVKHTSMYSGLLGNRWRKHLKF